MQIHLDPLGGLAGDMFAAAVLDAFPDLWPAVEESIAALGLGAQAQARLEPFRDATLGGHRFLVATAEAHANEVAQPQHEHDHATHDHAHGHVHPVVADGSVGSADGHGHRSWASIRAMIERSGLAAAVRDEAVAIFTLLAQAEAQVHGIAVDAVSFHEVGAVDSIVDIVAAARLIVGVAATAWTCAPLPLGSGRVRTAHGWLPVPAPATALLIRGLPTIDDGIAGERVTPTGAAILRRLLERDGKPNKPGPRVLERTGLGFGTRTLPGVSNCLRLLAFTDVPTARSRLPGAGLAHRELAVVAFEVDDQSPEDLAAGLDRLRDVAGVHDVVQSAAFGKKNRMAAHVQVLAAPEALDRTIAACFDETTTIGLRYHMVQGAVLARTMDEIEVDGRTVRVKSVLRPSRQRTAKAEVADAASAGDQTVRLRLRRTAEERALAIRAGAVAEPADKTPIASETIRER